jgi:hypothetical protein
VLVGRPLFLPVGVYMFMYVACSLMVAYRYIFACYRQLPGWCRMVLPYALGRGCEVYAGVLTYFRRSKYVLVADFY